MRYLIALALSVLTATAADRITATVTVTNSTIAGDAITVNGSTRTFAATVATPATEVLLSASIGGSATNLWNHFILSPPFTGAALRYSDTNAFDIIGNSGDALAATFSGTWAQVSYSTQTVTALQTVRVPMSSLPSAIREAHADHIIDALEDYGTTSLDQTAPVTSELVGIDNNQTIVGDKTFTGTTLLGSGVATTNLINYGNAIRSPGSGTRSEQFGTDATATGTETIAIGYGASATETGAIAIGVAAVAEGQGALSIGGENYGTESIAIGISSEISGDYAIALGPLTSANYDGSVAIGHDVDTTAAGEIRIGVTTNTVAIPGVVDVGTLTNSTYYGTVGLLSDGYWTNGITSGSTHTNVTTYGTHTLGGILKLPRTDYTTLANGDNSGVDFGSAVNIKIDDGPTGAFTIAGIAGGVDGRMLIINNRVAQALTIGHEDGAESTATRRILSPTGADLTSTTYCVVILVYDSEDERWHVVSFQD